MKYLNEESQFTRVSDEHARWLMEAVGFSVDAPSAVDSVYIHNGERFVLSEEVVEGEDDSFYLRIEHLSDEAVIQVDENGRETIIEEISFDNEDFRLSGVFEDEDGFVYAKMVSESVGDEDEDEEDEDDNEE